VADIIIRNYRREDEPAVEDITYRTGFKGEDLTGRDFFDDRRLFFMFFICYYTRYEPEHFFVALDTSNDHVVGFICGATDTAAQEKSFGRKMIPRIIARIFLYTTWRYPRTFKTLLGMMRGMGGLEDKGTTAAVRSDYPAHLHINLLPEYQHAGLGTRLMSHFEGHLIRQGVTGVHLQTTNHNYKAVPFYKKMGYAIVHETAAKSHPVFDNLTLITFAKRLAGQDATLSIGGTGGPSEVLPALR